ncbi:MAG: apolipoprotein N-acyltransferase [Bacteroidota bacterium]
MGLAFPPFPFGILACFGFIPFLLLTDKIKSFGRFFRYSYGTFLLFVLITLYWVGGFTHFKDPYLMFAGLALFLWQPFFFTIPASLYYFIRKNIPHDISILTFPLIWVTFEWLYALGEFAFPWLTIGNTQTYNLLKIQLVDQTGVYGLSLWVLSINILTFFFIRSLSGHYSKSTRFILLTAIVLTYVAPDIYGRRVEIPNSEKTGITVGIAQPNIDPWNKWEGAQSFSGRWQQIQSYLAFIRQHISESTDMVVLPESAMLLNVPELFEQSKEISRVVDSLDVTLLSGYAKVSYYYDNSAPVSSNVLKGTNIRYDSYNSILMFEPGSRRIQTYSKMRLVPFAERIPYADHVPFLIEPLRWGVGISNWGMGRDSTLFENERLGSKFLSMVCYESIFPEFVASFVNKGAEFLVFITNDSWWGNTSGARQHNQYAILRAVENRRWVVRCANGGISSFIDPFGNIYDQTKMYAKAYIQMKIFPKTEKSFYTLHGDWIARINASVTLIILILTIGYTFYRKRL